jgi:hypothetical protein
MHAISLTSVIVAHTSLQVQSTLTYLPSPGNVNQIASSSGKSLVKKQDPQNRSYPKPRKARKRHNKKKCPKPSPPSPPVTGALCAQIKETQQLPDHHHPSPSPWRAPMSTKRCITRDYLQHRIKLSVPSPQRLIHPPYPLTMESFYRWYAEQGCPKIYDDYSYSTRSIYDDPVLDCM